MPPVGVVPVPELILERIQALLALPDGGANYFHRFNVVAVGEDIFRAGVFPAITLGVGEIGRLSEERDGRVMWLDNYHWSLGAVCALEGAVGMHKELIRVLHDVHRALGTDPFLAGGTGTQLVKRVFITGAWFLPPQSTDDARCWVEIGIEVHFRTKETSMLEAA